MADKKICECCGTREILSAVPHVAHKKDKPDKKYNLCTSCLVCFTYYDENEGYILNEEKLNQISMARHKFADSFDVEKHNKKYLVQIKEVKEKNPKDKIPF